MASPQVWRLKTVTEDPSNQKRLALSRQLGGQQLHVKAAIDPAGC